MMCEDHLGNRYRSVEEMCKRYNILYATYHDRISKGWTLEYALTAPVRKIERQTTDHLGKEYNSITEMCKAYNINYNTYFSRLRLGMTQEEALTTPVINEDTILTDHLGITYRSAIEMCNKYRIPYWEFKHRMAKGYSIEKALTEPVNPSNGYECTDFDGNKFPSQTAMCDHYNIKLETYRSRINRGLNKKEALTLPIRHKIHKDSIVDHLGNKYDSIVAMCDHYNISYQKFRRKLQRGYTLEEVLTKDYDKNKTMITDHLGNKYGSILDMCRHYGISVSAFKARLKKSGNLEKSLTTPTMKYMPKRVIEDHLGNKFRSIIEMCNYHDINVQTYYSRIRSGLSTELALKLPVEK